jgi:serine/threonine-protein kinase
MVGHFFDAGGERDAPPRLTTEGKRAMTAALELLQPGDVIAERFRIEGVLGEGGMGVVYEATQINLDRVVALKVLLPEYWYREDARMRFQREAMVAAALHHPNAVTIFDFGEDQKRLFLAMERLRGETLRSELSKETNAQGLPLPRAVEITAQIASVLVAAHQMELVHRDLKPENIFLEPTDRGVERVVVVDFGLAFIQNRQDVGRMTRDGILSGTPTYISPEQVRAKGVGPAADVYSLGCVLHEMVTGVVPFSGDDEFEIISRHVYTPVTPPRDAFPDRNIPPSLDALVVDMLAKDQDRRPTPAQVIERLAPIGADASARERGHDTWRHLDRESRMVSAPRGTLDKPTLTDVEIGYARSKTLAVIGSLEEPVKRALATNGLRAVERTATEARVEGAVAVFAPGASLEQLAELAGAGLPVLTDAESADMGRISELLAIGIDDVVPLPHQGEELARKVWRAIRKSKRSESRER